MKQQQANQRRFSWGSSSSFNDQNSTISMLMSRSLIKNLQNKLIFISRAISMIRPIAYSYLQQYPDKHQSANYQILLIDFPQAEIDYLQQTLKAQALLHPKRRIFERDIANSLNIVKLSNQVIQKRKILYLQPGIFSVSSQIFLTDLLRGWNQLDGLKVKIIFKLTEKILTYHHYYAWITTILKTKEHQKSQKPHNISIIYISNYPHHYGDENELNRIYRTFFCKKVVIWPFGRAEIHKELSTYRQNNIFKQWEHNLSMSQGERKLYESLMELYYFLRKKLANKSKQKLMIGDHLLYSKVIQQGYSFTRGQYTEFQQLKLLLIHLQNSSKLTILNIITRFIQSKECEIWNSNNSEAILIIENIIQQLQSSIFLYQNRQSPQNINLIRLFSKNEEIQSQINHQRQAEYICTYPLLLALKIGPQTNEKLAETIKIIQTIEDPKITEQQKQMRIDQRYQEQLRRRLDKNQANFQDYHNVLIMCSTKGVQKFVNEGIEAYLTDKNYINYLLTLYRVIKVTRSFRLKRIKKIYDRRKIKKSDDQQAQKKNYDKKSWVEENKLIVKQILFHQLDKLNQILLNFEIKLNGLNEQSQKTKNSQQIFQNNIDQLKIIQHFNEQLLVSQFCIIDTSQIKAASLINKTKKSIFDTNNTKKRVIVDYQKKDIEPNYFYQLLDLYNPSTIIFYTPTPLLLRSLYLYQLQNKLNNLKQIHILHYQNSYETKKATFEVTKEDKAFWSISQNRSQLPEFIESPFLRIKSINFRDTIQQAKHRYNSKSMFTKEEGENSISSLLNLDSMKRKILIDTRQFKSTLPSYLYHYGFDVIPVFLKSADYVLADDTAIQKKSVHTRDLHNSLKSLRLEDQLKKMNSSFRHPYLLIECEDEAEFVKSNFSFLDGTSGNKSRYQLRKRIIQLLHKYQNVRIIWSTSVEQSCQLIRQLKEDKHDPDIARFTKDQNQYSEQKQERGQALGRINEVSEKKQQEAQQMNK